MTITICIDTGNDAFQNGNKEVAVARIVARCSRELECMSPGVRHALHDINGNRVGFVKVTER